MNFIALYLCTKGRLTVVYFVGRAACLPFLPVLSGEQCCISLFLRAQSVINSQLTPVAGSPNPFLEMKYSKGILLAPMLAKCIHPIFHAYI